MALHDVLESLESRLAGLARQGVRHLNVPPSAEAAELLASARAEAARARASAPPAGAAAPAPPPRDARPDPPGGPPAAHPPSEARVPPPGTAHPDSRPAWPAAGGKHPAELDSLESLHLNFRDCQRCGLAAGRTKLVFGVGHEKPKILFIGEGPGRDEDLQGLPFVGRAGQLLTAGIAALGLTRDDVYIANVVKCRPPENRVPAPDEVAACSPILQRQIELLDPAIIVVLGNVPLKALRPAARGITSERGRVFDHRQWKVLPTFHPAYLLRNANALDQWWMDLKQAFRMAYGTDA